MRVSRRRAVKTAATLTTATVLMIGFPAGADESAPWSEQQARLAVSRQFSTKSCGISIWLGDDPLSPSEIMMKGAKREFIQMIEKHKRELNALVDIGIVKTTNLPNLPGFPALRIELRDDVDQEEFQSYSPTHTCLKKYIPNPQVDVIKIEYVKGSITKSDVMVVNAVIKGEYAGLYAKYLHSMKFPIENVQKARLLYRHDIFQKRWNFAAMDIGPIDGAFTGTEVPKELPKD